MRKYFRGHAAGLALAACVLVPAPAAAGGHNQFKDLLDKAKQAARSQVDSNARTGQLPGSDIAAGLREALATGTTRAINSLGRDGGFWNNARVRIPLPGQLEQAGKLARQLGQGAKVDAFELSLNRAAEKAVPQVADIFGNAIRKMTLQDARGILAGGDHAATDFFRRVAGDELTARIRPIVARATDSVGVTRKYKALVSGNGGGSLGGALASLEALGGHDKGKAGTGSLDLDDYVTRKTMDGLFTEIGNEEQAIRHDPAARTTDLLRKVFGGG
ncbi:MAG TPA: DUF4197 domain-containing protein [Dyella sp.]|nr:DUF4197 domain-containing protein [Dyella sp.]